MTTIYDQIKKLDISTLEVHRLLLKAGVSIPKRTLHNYLQGNMENCKDGKVEEVVKIIIKNKKDLISSLEKLSI
jgi:hypothetical protein